MYVSVPPAATGSGASARVTERSALPVTVVVVVAVSFAASGSAVVAAMLAESVIVPGLAGAVTVIVIDGAAPAASDAAVQVTVPPLWLHVHPVPVALT